MYTNVLHSLPAFVNKKKKSQKKKKIPFCWGSTPGTARSCTQGTLCTRGICISSQPFFFLVPASQRRLHYQFYLFFYGEKKEKREKERERLLRSLDSILYVCVFFFFSMFVLYNEPYTTVSATMYAVAFLALLFFFEKVIFLCTKILPSFGNFTTSSKTLG